MNNPNNNSPVFNAMVDNIANVESIKAAAIERLKEKATLEDMELVRECNGFLAEIEQAKLNASAEESKAPANSGLKAAFVSVPRNEGETEKELMARAYAILDSINISDDTIYPWGTTVEVKVSEQPKEQPNANWPKLIITRDGNKVVIRLLDEDGNSTFLYGGEATLEVMN